MTGTVAKPSRPSVKFTAFEEPTIIKTEKGTKKMLLLVKKQKKHSGILIKFPKKRQDNRADLPTIGLETLKDCSKAGINGIVLKSNQNIFLDKKKSINYANKKKIFIKII